MSDPFPARPRLADHALVRRHLITEPEEPEEPGDPGTPDHPDADRGRRTERIVLHDPRTQQMLQLSPRIFALLEQADGTRDLDGIALAAARAGVLHRQSELRAMLEELHARGLLVDGIDGPIVTAAEEATPPDRPVRALPGFALACDGSGTCCRQYSSVAFTDEEASRARDLVTNIRSISADRVFLPLAGLAPPGPEPHGWAVTMVDGACAYLEGDGRCALHAAGGPEAKPRPCAIYPATFVDDGASVRVSIKVECACVVASVGLGPDAADARGAAPLVSSSVRLRSDLELAAQIRVLPAAIPVTRDGALRDLTREEYVAWSDALQLRLATEPDAAEACWSAARALDDRLTPARLVRFVAAFHARALSTADSGDEWRGALDVARIGRRRVADAARALLGLVLHDPTARPAIAYPEIEIFYARAALFGHHLVGESSRLLVDALCDRAVRLLVARMIPARDALSLVEAITRGHRLEGYVDDV